MAQNKRDIGGGRPPAFGRGLEVQTAVAANPLPTTPQARNRMDAGQTVSMPSPAVNAGRILAANRMPQSARTDPPPVATPHDPPEVSLTQHELPQDAPLDPRLILLAEPDSERASSFRVLRHHLMETGRPQVIVVSSPSPREGKTTCAVNLALALAECNRARVLLVEATVRRPQLAAMFRFVPPWCFAEQLSAHRHQPLLPWGLVEIPDMWLHVAAINPRVEQRQILDAPAFAIAMERLRLASYDHIVIDAPAVLGRAEVNLIQDAADGVILTAWGKQTTARDLRQAVHQLSPTKIIGTVLMEQ
jgi:Mrp family chromosome partitioning ATPase